MTNKHTPGPWEIVGQGDRYLIRDGHKTSSVAMVLMRDNDDKECIKHARLIAAAPDLLAALIAAERAMQADISDVDIGATFEQVRTAIAKAYGHATRE